MCPGFVPATVASGLHGSRRLFMRYVMPHMRFATSLDDATSSLAFMALDPSLEGVGGSSSLNAARSAPARSRTIRIGPAASGSSLRG